MTFHWYHANGDGTADRYEDSPAICARIDAGEPGWFGSPEGAILHGGVVATAFEIVKDKMFDTRQWLATNGKDPGTVWTRTTLKITECIHVAR
jgi:hypothetical protein